MWKRLPLRFRLFLPTIALIAATLLFGIFALQIFSPDQFENESEDAAALVRTVTNGLNAALAVTVNPQQALDAFVDFDLHFVDGVFFREDDFGEMFFGVQDGVDGLMDGALGEAAHPEETLF